MDNSGVCIFIGLSAYSTLIAGSRAHQQLDNIAAEGVEGQAPGKTADERVSIS